MGEGETDTGRFDEVTPEDVERLRPDLRREATFQAAREIMEQHAEQIAGDPVSRMDQLLDEFVDERNKTIPDPRRLDYLRHQMHLEHTFVAPETVTSASAERHLQDIRETQELNDRETAVREVAQLAVAIPGFVRDIREMADQAINSDLVEQYPDEMAAVIAEADGISEVAEASITEVLEIGTVKNFFETLQDEHGLLQLPFETLKTIYAHLIKAQHELIDAHSRMLKVADQWRKEHPSA